LDREYANAVENIPQLLRFDSILILVAVHQNGLIWALPARTVSVGFLGTFTVIHR